MSIYCSFGGIGDVTDKPNSRKKPMRYQGSHVLPSRGDEHCGSVYLAYIPSHIRRGNRLPPKNGNLRSWLRLGVASDDDTTGEVVVLSRKQVEKLHDDLGWWLYAYWRGKP